MALWHWANFGYDASYLAVCQDYSARCQTCWDFVVCEGARGWPSSHITSPFVVYLFFGHFWAAWLVPGIFELFEVLVLTLFGNFIVFPTADTDRETLAGALLGDWLINGSLGVIAAWLLRYAFSAPGLLPRWRRYWKPAGWREGGALPKWYLVDEPDYGQSGPAAPSAPKHAAFTVVWVRQLFFWFFFGVLHIGVAWVRPDESCIEAVPNTCLNAGLILVTFLDLVVFVIIFISMYRTARVTRRYVIGAYSWRKLAWYLACAWLFMFSVQLQNWQPLVPLYLGVAGAFTQAWAAAITWILALFLGVYVPNEWPRWRYNCETAWRALRSVRLRWLI